jgi:predicted Zn finger-like uncharacterized protein
MAGRLLDRGIGDDTMRLICPNCAAQYEVDDGVIPSDGRDVQCSNCGHAWFQPGAYAEPSEPSETSDWTGTEVSAPDDDIPEEETADILETVGESVGLAAEDQSTARAVGDDDRAQTDDLPEADTIGFDGAVGQDDESGTATTDPVEEAPPAPVSAPPVRQELDESVLSILKEEAERETEARRAEGSSLETQPDLGLVAAIGAMVKDDPTAQNDGMTDRAASQRDSHAEADDDMAQTRGPRRELLPDIEEINSTLSAKRGRTSEDPGGSGDAERTERRRSGFRRGFSLALLLTVLLLALYALAPAISTRVPALAGVLDQYVMAVNSGRLWLDELMKSSTEALRQDDAQGG